MDKTDIIFNLAEILGCEARKYEPLSKHTTFKIGGVADTYVKVTSLSKLSTILKECRESDIDYMIIGNGSNILASDDGYRGVVIRLDGDFRKIALVDDDTVYCGAGATLAALCKFALNNGLSGLEFAWGIPGSVGGAVFMNAGAYGGEMKDVVYSVNHLTKNGEPGRTEKDALQFGYRTSVYRQNNAIITGATLKLRKDNPEDIRARMDDYLGRRSSKQPLEYPSAGSVFKRPAGAYAGALIEQCGLKGHSHGGAQVSEKHAGFIINKANANANDVKSLIREVQTKVYDETGYNLECELIIL
ncbi:MAG: UDP-N-acetylmuramate dehydrogenase [Ruminococcus sp.]|jgi:UDP-N-acetylmuramate dehydrogenase|nr:UDP-N-acetylmuramate dehydrogenase [Ruminococcus sp.]MBQ1806612.1 UDP-N-acetylmuramate dehydrogenase [Ruminococcus sp.]MBQ3954033.1 UDP-N-acetylmuramate dehydrogenase [Ruminococcus sp.]MBQ3987982.1 UDP-N-acetylmuramate dehydrogenase [Ruminococcus sp.]MBQ4179650.1 UDP-N-acetylmuramate dehydrogenase [Ruminococcus sp.]